MKNVMGLRKIENLQDSMQKLFKRYGINFQDIRYYDSVYENNLGEFVVTFLLTPDEVVKGENVVAKKAIAWLDDIFEQVGNSPEVKRLAKQLADKEIARKEYETALEHNRLVDIVTGMAVALGQSPVQFLGEFKRKELKEPPRD